MAVERELRSNLSRGPAQPPHVARPHLPGRVPLQRRQERRKRAGRPGQAPAGSERVSPDQIVGGRSTATSAATGSSSSVSSRSKLLEVVVGQRQPFEQCEDDARLDAHVADAHVAALIDDERVLPASRLAPPVAEPTAVSAPGVGRGRRAKVGCRNRHGATLRPIRERRQDALSDMAQSADAAAIKSSVRGGAAARRRAAGSGPASTS